ncbi:hypothetical protein IMG5_177180 [Ichthyophthirius multifiliis]|uniref:Malectin domain-containing protein n=1 Tax=Ichthyophthirius multifiliis TaxID=5932 RepID=G0R2D5_ICHMU|nr:hypothetical protein IMG5_177180 [Ichthyophthirius multifiliis]EGR28371.1 hypothetical protein IMG5_177180 [Ichthyophthirius multifiliis]|eukprot:XP_004027716.1 hypothetical protein IMG5_177180 [Ichthyophthirius multifiliis]
MKKQIKYTDDPLLYKTERHSDESFAYSLPLNEYGTYTVILKFCELYFTEVGKRIFNISFGDTIVYENLDIVKEVGYMAALDIYLELEYRDKNVYFNGILCENAIDRLHQGLLVEFQKGQKDLPKVDAIMLINLPKNKTNFDEYQNLINTWQEEIVLSIEEVQYQKMKELRNKIKEDFDSNVDFTDINFRLRKNQ